MADHLPETTDERSLADVPSTETEPAGARGDMVPHRQLRMVDHPCDGSSGAHEGNPARPGHVRVLTAAEMQRVVGGVHVISYGAASGPSYAWEGR